MSLIDLIKDKYKTISIVGMAKNTGKTVTMNHILFETFEKGLTAGVTSTGRNGENLDIVTETEKPRVFLEEGTIVATTTKVLPLEDAKVEILKVTDYRTPMGSIVIGRVKDRGYIQIAGPQRVNEIKEVSQIMLNFGADFVIIDGAIDRRSSAAPFISDGTILSTGAVLNRDMNRVIEETAHVVNLFNIPQIRDEKLFALSERIMREGKVCLIDKDYNTSYVNIKTALNSGNIIGDNIKESTEYIVIPGSLSKNTIEEMLINTRKYKDVKIIIKDGTKVFISPKDWLRFIHYGVKIEVMYKINLLAITANPYSPKGYYFDPEKFLYKLKKYIKDIPIYDLVLRGD